MPPFCYEAISIMSLLIRQVACVTQAFAGLRFATARAFTAFGAAIFFSYAFCALFGASTWNGS
jgi:hypothetical protein